MFCPQCGKDNQETGAFCIYCGNRLPVSGSASDDEVASNYAQQVAVEHDALYMTSYSYRKLGGWLAIICYGRLLSAMLELAICIAVIFSTTCFEYYQNGSRTFIGLANFARAMASRGISSVVILCYGSLSILVLYIVLLFSSIVMYKRIKKRKANCIIFYRIVAVVISCFTIVAFVWLMLNRDVYFIVYGKPIMAVTVWLLLDMLISLLVFNTYFRKSNRVRVYFEDQQ